MSSQEIKSGAIWATREQLATRYCVHARTIDEWRKQGNLPAFKQGTRLIRFDISACDLWLNKYRHAAKWEDATLRTR